MAKANKSMLENNYGKREKKRQKEAIWIMTLLTFSCSLSFSYNSILRRQLIALAEQASKLGKERKIGPH